MSITTQQAKQISIVGYLSKRGYKPAFTRKGEHWYLSPLRKETKASFAVKEGAGTNGEDLWDDFGSDSGGSIIDLAMAMEQVGSVSGILKHLADYYNGSATAASISKRPQNSSLFDQQKTSSIKNVVVRPLNHYVLLQYLKGRGISEAIAKKYLKLIWYENNGRKNLFSFGWQNESGAWELRSNQSGERSFKAVTGKKDLTIFRNGVGEQLFVFEGMLDYLSALEIKGTTTLDGDVVILNSTTLVSRLLPFLKQGQYKTVYTFFDNDRAGAEALARLVQGSGHLDIRQQAFYAGFKDLNEYWVGRGV